MSLTVADRIASLTSLGGEAAARNHERFSADLHTLLALPPTRVPDRNKWRAAIAHGFAYYYWRWDRRAIQHQAEVEAAILRWSSGPDIDLDVLCELVDFFFFLIWCFNDSGIDQCRQAMRGMRAAARAFAFGARSLTTSPPPAGQDIHVAWLAMFASTNDPMSSALGHVAPALLAHNTRFRLTVIAWRQAEPSFIDWLQSLGAECHRLEASTPSATIAAVESLAAGNPPSIVISDMNNAVPTALFARRLAPAQMFLQGGMPVWPVRPLDGVFNSFGFDPDVAGWGKARMLAFNPPWDLAKLNPPENPAEVAAQRGLFPASTRLVGNYGRLVKLSEPCLLAAERILLAVPDVAFVTGGTGDASAIRAFIARSPVGDRMHLVEGFVPGHSWGRFLELFLDTWPVTGGESCRETMAKHVPVVTMHSDEMPAIDAQRDEALVAHDWDEYVAISIQLLNDPNQLLDAGARAAALAQTMTDQKAFARRLATDLDRVLDDARDRYRWTNRLWGSMRRFLGVDATT